MLVYQRVSCKLSRRSLPLGLWRPISEYSHSFQFSGFNQPPRFRLEVRWAPQLPDCPDWWQQSAEILEFDPSLQRISCETWRCKWFYLYHSVTQCFCAEPWDFAIRSWSTSVTNCGKSENESRFAMWDMYRYVRVGGSLMPEFLFLAGIYIYIYISNYII